ADILGRVCGDADEVLDNIALFREYCAERRCLDRPREFANDHARFMYFRTPGRDPDYAAYDDTRVRVTVMSGLPAAGKDHWIATNRAGWPVISLDALRQEFGVRPGGDQGPVMEAAYRTARGYLRSGQPYVWNATNLTRQLRERCIDLAAGYGARIDIVALEAAPDVLRARNGARTRPV